MKLLLNFTFEHWSQFLLVDTTQTTATATPQLDAATPSSTGEAAGCTSSSVCETGQKRTAEEASVDEAAIYQPPKRAAGPYGGWTTVAVRSV